MDAEIMVNLKGKKSGVVLIVEEREEQINKHGFTMERDKYPDTTLADLAVYLLVPNTSFPKGISSVWRDKLNSKKRTEKLIIAGAFLIAAEIDRINNFYPE